jgi:hypothetical protein
MLRRLRSTIARGMGLGLARFNLTIRDISTIPTWDAFFNQIKSHHLDIRSIFDIGVDQGTLELYGAFPNAELFLFDPTPRAANYMKGLAARRESTRF